MKKITIYLLDGRWHEFTKGEKDVKEIYTNGPTESLWVRISFEDGQQIDYMGMPYIKQQNKNL